MRHRIRRRSRPDGEESAAEAPAHTLWRCRRRPGIPPRQLGCPSSRLVLLSSRAPRSRRPRPLRRRRPDAFDFDGNETDEYDTLQDEIIELEKIVDKPVLIYCSDIRQGHGKGYDDPDRAEFSTNQFVYGMVLSLTNGEGFISWEEVLKRLEKLGEQDG